MHLAPILLIILFSINTAMAEEVISVKVYSPYCDSQQLRSHLLKNDINQAMRPKPMGSDDYQIILEGGTMAQVEKIKNIVKARCAITPGGLKEEVKSVKMRSPYCDASRIRQHLLANKINNAKVQALGNDEYHIILYQGNKAQLERIRNLITIHCLDK